MPWYRFDQARDKGTKGWISDRVKHSWFQLPNDAAALERATHQADILQRPVTFKQVKSHGDLA